MMSIKISKSVLLFILTVITFLPMRVNGQEQFEVAKNMVDAIMKTFPDSMVVKSYMNQFVLEKLANGEEVDLGPDKGKGKIAKWDYEIGVVLSGVEKLWRSTGDPKYLNYIRKIMDHFIDKNGDIKTYEMAEFNLDNLPAGRQLITLYQTFRDKKYLAAANVLHQQLEWQPRTKEGGYWHKLKYPYQMWLDGAYMAEPFRAEYLNTTGNNKEWDDVAYQFIWMADHTCDFKSGLMYHGYDESRIQAWAEQTSGHSPEFWSRSMGWYLMGLIDVLEEFPEDNIKQKKLIQIFQNLSNAVLQFQDQETGVWWQVTNKAGKENNYLESSGSSMFVAAMLKGVRMGFLSREHLPAIKKGYAGLVKQFVSKDAQGLYHLNQSVGGAGLGGDPYRDGSYEYYVNEPKRNDDLKAIGPFILASIEADLIEMTNFAKDKNVVLDRFYNNEYRDGARFHYTWEDPYDSGFSWFGNIFSNYGAHLSSLDEVPTTKNLKGADVYIIVDPDTEKETKSPNYIAQQEIATIKKWVEEGGNLLLMTNDTTNAEIIHSNELAKAFGIQFTNKNIHFVKNDQFEQGTIIIPEKNEIFTTAKQVYVKELVTLNVKKPAVAQIKSGKDIVMATAQIGKGKVFVIGDPWLYNEYVNGRKLPGTFHNYQAASDLARWLLK